MTTPAETELRAGIITALKADTGVRATAMGAAPRIMNRVPPGTVFPYVTITTSNAKPWDTDFDRGYELDVELRIMGDGLSVEGDEEGEAIFNAFRRKLRDWAPQDFTSHHLVNLIFRFQDVRPDEDAKRYIGLQHWRAVLEETA